MSEAHEGIDPEYIQRNVESLSQIGGAYDYIASAVEEVHIDILTPYRARTGRKTLAEIWRNTRPDLAGQLTERHSTDKLEIQPGAPRHNTEENPNAEAQA